MEKAARAFAFEGNLLSCELFGSGHINKTYRVKTDAGCAYVLQRINHHVFRDVPALMKNLTLVIEHLKQRDPDPRHVLSLVPTTDGRMYFEDENGEYWRATAFIDDAISLDLAQSAEDLRQNGYAFGHFRQLLADFPATTLSETIPNFHHTPLRMKALEDAVKDDRVGRVGKAKAEIEFALGREPGAGRLIAMQRAGDIPTCVTHNDTKLNNVMLDRATRKALCVVDLDTVMPGLAAYDFGDSIRFGASTAAEDERELDRVKLDMGLYRAYVKGYITDCQAELTVKERESLVLGAQMMTLECGVRFLTDYLMGDTYFGIARPEHNLDRARAQFALLRSMDQHLDEMNEVTQNA